MATINNTINIMILDLYHEKKSNAWLLVQATLISPLKLITFKRTINGMNPKSTTNGANNTLLFKDGTIIFGFIDFCFLLIKRVLSLVKTNF